MDRISKGNRILLEQMVQDIGREYDACGIALAIVDGKGDTKYQKFFGYRDKEAELPVDENTIFGLASVTKSFTSLAIMQMAEKGIISLNDPISQYIPEFTNKNQDTVRIWHLLCHSGGFFPLPRIVVDQVAEQLGLDETVEGDLAYSDKLAQEGIRLVAQRLDEQTMKQGLNGRAGQYLSYCNDGFGLLSDIIRRYGGEASYADYLNQHILKPLDMTRSGCDFVKPSQDPNAAVLYKTEDGVKTHHRNYHDNAFVLNGGGAMKSTLADLKKYVAMYLNKGMGRNGTQILSQYGIEEMCKPRQIYRHQSYYGYGLSIDQLDDMTVIGHGGSLPGVSSNISWSYEADAAVIVLCNTSGVPVSLIADGAMRMYHGLSPVRGRAAWQEEPWSQETMEQAAGMYISGEGSQVELYQKEDGSLGMRLNEQEQNVIPVSPYTAVICGKRSDGMISLYRRNGNIFAIRYGGRMIPKVN